MSLNAVGCQYMTATIQAKGGQSTGPEWSGARRKIAMIAKSVAADLLRPCADTTS